MRRSCGIVHPAATSVCIYFLKKLNLKKIFKGTLKMEEDKEEKVGRDNKNKKTKKQDKRRKKERKKKRALLDLP